MQSISFLMAAEFYDKSLIFIQIKLAQYIIILLYYYVNTKDFIVWLYQT